MMSSDLRAEICRLPRLAYDAWFSSSLCAPFTVTSRRNKTYWNNTEHALERGLRKDD